MALLLGTALAVADETNPDRAEAMRAECPKVAFIKRHYFRPPFGFGTLLCWDVFQPGGSICIYDPGTPDQEVKEVFRSDDGVVFDMSLSPDAGKLLFAWMKLGKDDSFHVYEINLDGSGLRQLTTGPYHDVSPIYLPGGEICFASTRVESYQMCQPGPACALFTIDADGENLRRIEFGTLGDYSPWLLDNGSILFTRWEYQDKSIFTLQSLWTINPDGTRVRLFFGNTITNPNVLWQAKSIPGTEKFICTMAPHHQNPVGAIGIIDRRHGLENLAGLRNITPEIDYQPSREPADWEPGDRSFRWSYRDPYPVGPNLFLTAYGGPPPEQGGPGRYRLLLLDEQGHRAPLYEDPNLSCFSPVPLVPRRTATQIPGTAHAQNRDSLASNTGAFFVQDVYRGLLGVKRGMAKEIRVMSTVAKRTNMRGQRAYDQDPLVGRGTYYVKECFGTVPIEEDGSAYFKVPAGRELYFQLLDASGKELCRMGSVTQVMPGETQGCIGCHEPRSMAPPVRATIALRSPPRTITPPAWGAGPVDFVRHVQPAFDRYCVECHRGDKLEGDLDLSGDKTRFFNMAYDQLTERRLIEFYWLLEGPTGNFRPLSTGSYVSKLTELIESGHDGQVDMDDQSRRRIYAWIDANVPYYPSYEHTRPGTAGSRDAWAGPWLAALREACASQGITQIGDADVNLTHPEFSRVLRAFKDKNASAYQAALSAIRQGKEQLETTPRIDMPNAKPLPYPQGFGRLFSGYAGP